MSSVFLIVASNLVVSSCIAALAYCVGRWGRSATLAHLLWMAVFIKLITPPLVVAPVKLPGDWGTSLQSVYRGIDIDPAVAIASEASNRTMSISEASTRIQPASNAVLKLTSVIREITLSRFLIAIWALGTSIIFIRGLVRFAQFSRLLTQEGVVDDEATAVVARLVAGRRNSVPIVRRITARVSPMLFGVGPATCIVCPNRLWDQLTETQREAFLAHEVAHFMRRDHWLRWLEWFVTAVYWWCPLVYVARQQLERHEEAACDAWAVLRLNASRRVYAETLLNVVDFLSENRVGTPRLASRMQGTDSLEERLRLIMSAGKDSGLSAPRCIAIATLGLVLLLMHPVPKSVAASIAVRPTPAFDSAVTVRESTKTDLDTELHGEHPPLVALPPVPRGWWNELPRRTWADVRMGDTDLRLLAEAGVGISLIDNSQSQHMLDSQSVRAIAYVASTGRLIIGNSKGELHLWDVVSSQAVSLIGRHPESITSLAYHPKSGLVSGDAAGNIMAWDIQSGRIKGATSVGGPVGSVRWATRGDKLAVVVSDWASANAFAELLMLDGNSLTNVQTLQLPHHVAIAQQHSHEGWLAVDWSGTLWSLVSGNAVGSVPKEYVSAVLLCQDILDRTELLAIGPKLENENE
ncbi:MAG: M56 family metallopeptidase [Pirellulaceae bacterium]|nr:M56 family metallopeptidase [Pirellulaceae bacterium]